MSEAPRGKQENRQLIWGGLAARCSACHWRRLYVPEARVHYLPSNEASDMIQDEFQTHRCEEFMGRISRETRTHAAMQVNEKLRISLAPFVGADGFALLQRRPFALARLEVPSLQVVTFTPKVNLEGILDKDGGAANAITAYLLVLLGTFIGESLTLRLLRDAWLRCVIGRILPVDWNMKYRQYQNRHDPLTLTRSRGIFGFDFAKLQ